MENITVNMENLTEDERKQLLALVEKGNKTKKVWKPKKNEEYFLVTSHGTISKNLWINDMINNRTYNFGNCYRAEKEAEFALEKRKVEVELKRFSDEHNDVEIDWFDNHQAKYYLWLDSCDDEFILKIGCAYSIKTNDTYFSSEEIAEQAIKEIGEERLKKYYFEAVGGE